MGSCLEFITLCPQHIPRTRNVPPGEQGTKPMKTSFLPNPGEESLHFPAAQPRLSSLCRELLPCSPGWDTDVRLYALTGPYPSPPPPAVPSQPPENVRALSITSDVAVISWSEPPRSTLNGVLKGYRVIFWSLYVDGGECPGSDAWVSG